MKLRKRALSVLLSLAMILSALPVAAQAAGSVNFRKVNTYRAGQFTDVPAGSWYADSVRSAYELGLMQGTGEKTFSPDGDSGKVTLAQAVTMAARIHSIYTTGAENFPPDGHEWYSPYVNYAKRNGILDKDFPDYNAAATREQFAVLFAHALPTSNLIELNSIPDGGIPDVLAIHEHAAEIYLLFRAGVLTGSDNGKFLPNDTITRAQAAAVVTRMALPAQRVRLDGYSSPNWRGDDNLDFTASITNGRGRSVTLSRLMGKVVLVNFWATWCNPCVREMPDLQRLYDKYGSGGQVEILAINVREGEATVNRFMAQQEYTFPIICDIGGNIADAYQVSSIPRTVIFNKDGTIAADFTGSTVSNNYERLESAISEALAR